MPTVTFQRPAALIGLAALPFLWLLWSRACRVVRRFQHLSGGPASAAEPDRTSTAGANAARGALRLAALASLIVGLADPAAFAPGALSPASVPVVFVLDVSASMEARDVEPDRLAAAREAIAHLCSLVPAGRTALVALAQDAAVVCPLTADRAAFLDLLAQARTDWTGAGGTRLLPALRKARDLIIRDGGAGVVVLLSDGENHGESPHRILEQMRRDGIALHTVVVGSREGMKLEGRPAEGVITRAQPEQMAAWAAGGGGRAWAVTPRGKSLPMQAEELVARGAVRAAALQAGAGRPLSPYLYLLAAILLIADRLLRPS